MAVKIKFFSMVLAFGCQFGMLLALQESPKPKTATSRRGTENKKVYTNEDLEQIPHNAEMNQGSKSSSDRGSTPVAQSSKKDSSLDLDHYVDHNGHGREFWHKQSQSMRDKLESVCREIEILEKQKKDLSGSRGIRVTRSGEVRASGDVSRVETRLVSCQKEKSQLQRQTEQMEEDARKAGALPEWLR